MIWCIALLRNDRMIVQVIEVTNGLTGTPWLLMRCIFGPYFPRATLQWYMLLAGTGTEVM